jgi:ABC-type tungstate transport system substrate-binding protein
LETSEGNFPVALQLGAVLIGLSIAVSTAAFWIERRMRGTSIKEKS